jgi:hypothetical protein
MNKFALPTLLVAIATASASPAMSQSEASIQAQRGGNSVKTEVYQQRVVDQFNQCMEGYSSAGANITNGVYLNCLPSNDELFEVVSGTRSVATMSACVDWSLALMGGVINSEFFRRINSKTICGTEGLETVSLLEMLGYVITSEFEPYGI